MDSFQESFTEKIKLNGKVYEYLMTSDTKVLESALKKLGCRLPRANDYRYNPALSNQVRQKMIEKNARWSLTVSHNENVLNYFSPNKNGQGTPFIVYLCEIMNLEIAAVAKNLDFSNLNNFTPLSFAIIKKNKEIVRFLVEHGADVNAATDLNGMPPLMIAAALNETEIMRILISHGADVNKTSKNGMSALVLAIFANSLDAVKLLQENNANLNVCITPARFDGKSSFSEKFEFFLSNYSLKGLASISNVYKRCGMSKQQFSKIRSKGETYHPQKRTVLQLIIGMKLNLGQAEQLLESAGYFFEKKDKTDQIIKDFIEHLNYDIFEIDRKVFEQTGKSFLKDYEESAKEKKVARKLTARFLIRAIVLSTKRNRVLYK